MSAVKGVYATKADDPSPSNVLNPGVLGAKVRMITDYYEAAGLANGSTIKIGKPLPQGAVIVGAQLAGDALGTGVTLVLGDSDSVNRYVTALTCTSAANTNALAYTGIGYVVGTNDGDDAVLVKTSGAAATGTIYATLFYTLE